MLRQLRERMLRIRELMDCLLSATPEHSTAAPGGAAGRRWAEERRSCARWCARQLSLLAAKVTERSAETGEHYITRTPAEYREHAGQGGRRRRGARP